MKEILVGVILGVGYGILVGATSEFVTGIQLDNLGIVIGLSIALSLIHISEPTRPY